MNLVVKKHLLPKEEDQSEADGISVLSLPQDDQQSSTIKITPSIISDSQPQPISLKKYASFNLENL